MQCVGKCLSCSGHQCDYQAVFLVLSQCGVGMPVCPGHAQAVGRTIMTATFTEESLPCYVLEEGHRPHSIVPQGIIIVSLS